MPSRRSKKRSKAKKRANDVGSHAQKWKKANKNMKNVSKSKKLSWWMELVELQVPKDVIMLIFRFYSWLKNHEPHENIKEGFEGMFNKDLQHFTVPVNQSWQITVYSHATKMSVSLSHCAKTLISKRNMFVVFMAGKLQIYEQMVVFKIIFYEKTYLINV